MPPTATAAAPPGSLVQLAGRFASHADFAAIAERIRRREPVALDGVFGSSCALVCAALVNQLSDAPPLLVVLPTPAEVDALADDLALFSAVAPLIYPAWEEASADQPLRDEAHGERLRLLKGLLRSERPQLILTSMPALLQPAPQREALARLSRRLRVGDSIDADELARWLAGRRFHSTTAVELPGEFSRRGGIFDVFGPDWIVPVRIELFGDEIHSLRAFDTVTQRSLEAVAEIDLTVLAEGGAAGAEEGRSLLSEYLPEGTPVLLVEPGRLKSDAVQFLERVEQISQFFAAEEVLSALLKRPHATCAAISEASACETFRLPVESVERFGGDFQKVRGELDRLAENHEVYVVVQTEGEVQRLGEVFAATQAAAAGKLHFPLGRLQSGFRLRGEQALVISGSELFHRGDIRRTAHRRLGKAIDSFLDLREGDLVVHLSHGIGRYRGLKLLQKDTQAEEHLEVEFHGGTKVYVPVTKIDLVQKYVGGARARPALAKLGGKGWVRQKQAAEQSVVDLAAELLEMQAMRATRPGISFGPDTEWQHEFDRMFPYQETPDQLSAIAAIKQDMQRARPMDRLLCGDVGFGKTEVAMRAAFKAIDNGYQVAVLVPTTILCEQHYSTFQQRMAEFPCTVAKLSRFSTGAQQRQVLSQIASGHVDLVVGTHRLASTDVVFHNLGLVVIDEEQRFGVEVKERLKALRSTVDVLTMTATPIPRTLHLSLTGLRDISNLESPPEERLAVETKVSRFDRDLIRGAVLRELSRGGQIYFVHNRVHDIEITAKILRQTVPEARLRIGHGQMPEDELEEVMVDFIAHRFDLLLATTIVESGLDIPNANTIFIDEADRYGLADLHQLRGRVGRYKHRAYCYLLLDPRKSISPNAARRLRAIEEFSEIGAGFAIAMRDLEIRGAGNILGAEQSGHIAAVGYEFYCQLLEIAVRRLKQLPPVLKLEVDLDLPGEAYLPRDYVPDMRLKIDIYRRLTRLESDEHLTDLRRELRERFGPLPDPVDRLLRLAELRIEAAIWQLISVRQENRYLVLGYSNRSRAEQLVSHSKGRVRLVDDRSCYLTIPQEVTTPDRLISFAKSVLRGE